MSAGTTPDPGKGQTSPEALSGSVEGWEGLNHSWAVELEDKEKLESTGHNGTRVEGEDSAHPT